MEQKNWAVVCTVNRPGVSGGEELRSTRSSGLGARGSLIVARLILP